MLATLVPAWAVVGVFAIDTLHGTRWLILFAVLWAILAAAFFVYVLRQTLAQRRQANRRKQPR